MVDSQDCEGETSTQEPVAILVFHLEKEPVGMASQWMSPLAWKSARIDQEDASHLLYKFLIGK